jgi:trehalose synthase
MAEAISTAANLRDLTDGRVIWNVNSTSAGGGVAEMLHRLVGYGRDAGIDVRWTVIGGDPEFFTITKRIHNRLHGAAGDGGPLGPEQRSAYETTIGRAADEFVDRVQAGDIVLLHDPQTAGLIPNLRAHGASIIWRCHVGTDAHNEHSLEAWEFLKPYIEQTQRTVFSREAYVPPWLDKSRLRIIPPNIDPFSAKNCELSPVTISGILTYTGVAAGVDGPESRVFTRADGTRHRVERTVGILRMGPPPPENVPLVVQVSRWDALKDPIGVIEGFKHFVEAGHPSDAHLMLVGPHSGGVTDDPEGAEVFEETTRYWHELDAPVRMRAHLVCVPMDDLEENAVIVNAIQQHATVVVQKSLQEGFGLTVTEAMWKAKPVLASRVGGIQDQIAHQETGVLVDDPRDPEEFADALVWLLSDPARSLAIGKAAKERVRTEYLGLTSLIRYAQLIEECIAEGTDGSD